MSRVTVLGLGAMGSRMAVNLIAAGHRVTVWNRTAENCSPLIALGAKAATRPCEAVYDAEFVISMLRDDEASRSVWLDPHDGALSRMTEGAVIIESTTLTTDWVRELGKAAQDAGVGFVDACVSGSRPQVDAKQLVYFVGGTLRDFEVVEPVLIAAGGAQIHHVGDIGAGSAVKLATNVLLGVQTVAMAEALSLLKREGLDPLRAIDVIGTTFVCSPFAKGIGTLIAKGVYVTMFATDLVEKDMRYALLTGKGAELPLIAATHAVFQDAVDHGWATENLSSVGKLYD